MTLWQWLLLWVVGSVPLAMFVGRCIAGVAGVDDGMAEHICPPAPPVMRIPSTGAIQP